MSTIKVTNLRHESATSDNISLTSTNRVGIGTSSPSVVVEAQAAQAELLLKSTSGTNSSGLRFVPGGETNALYIYADGSRNINIDNHATSIASFRAGGGLTFNGDTSTDNALDDYEEGTWTPNIGGTATYDIQWGYYVKVGAMVHCWGGLRPDSMGTGNNKIIKGLPFTAINSPSSTQTGGGMITWHDNAPQSFTNTPALAIVPNTTDAYINGKDAASGVLQDNRNFWQNNHRANFFLTYRVTL